MYGEWRRAIHIFVDCSHTGHGVSNYFSAVQELSHCPLETLLGIDGVSEHFRLQI